MGSADSKLNFRKAVIQLTTKTQVRAAMSRGGCGEGRGGEGGGRHVGSRPEPSRP